MAGILLFENILDNVTLFQDTTTSGDPANLIDGRLDTNWTGSNVQYDLKIDVLESVSLTYTTSTVTIASTNRKESGFYNGHNLEILTGAQAGEVVEIDEYDGATGVATFVSGDTLTGSGTESCDVYLIPSFDTLAIAGQNIKDSTAKTVRIGSADTTSPLNLNGGTFDVLTDDVQVIPLDADLHAGKRYIRIAISSSTISVLYLGQRLVLGDAFDQFALRAPFSPAGIYQTIEKVGLQNNNGRPFPCSARDMPFDVDLDFRHLDADYFRSELKRGMYDLMQTQPFFIAWDEINHGMTAAYPEAAYCWTEQTIQPPTIPDYNGRMNWRVQAKGLKR